MRSNVPLSTLRMFEAAARLESFQAAASELNVSPSAVSQQVGNLEKRLGLALFSREYRRVVPTRKGRELGAALSKGFHIIDTALIAADPSISAGPVRCAVYQTFAARWLIPRLESINDDLADVSIELETGMHSVRFLKNNCDLAVMISDFAVDDMRNHHLFKETLVPVCAPRLASKLQHVDDILRQTMLNSSNRSNDWNLWLSEVGLKKPVNIRQLVFSNSSLAYEAAIAGAGVAIAQPEFLEGNLLSGQLVVPFDIPVSTGRSYFLLEPLGGVSRPAVRIVRDWILKQISTPHAERRDPILSS